MNRWTSALILAVALLVAPTARADDTFTFGGAEIELSGEWHLFVTIELASAPRQSRVPIEFRFTPRVVYDRTLAPGQSDPIVSSRVVVNAPPLVVERDVDFPVQGKTIASSTRFDFGVSRKLGFQAGEYSMEVCRSDGSCLDGPVTVALRGDNPIREAGAEPMKAGAAADASASAVAISSAPPVTGPAVQGATTRKPGGCGCEAAGASRPEDGALAIPILGFVAFAIGRRRSRSSDRVEVANVGEPLPERRAGKRSHP